MKDSDNPLIAALAIQNQSLALKAIEMGEDVKVVNEFGDTALMMAVGMKEVFQAIVEKKPDIGAVNDDEETVLHVIALNGSVDELASIKNLIKKAGEIDRQNTDGNSPLFLAVSNQYVFAELINLGANLFLKNKNDETILHRIAEVGTVDDLELLSNQRFDFNCQDKWGNTPLHIAASNGDYEIIEMLIKLGAEVNSRNDGEATPLHWAINSNFISIEVENHIRSIKTLLKHGADIQAKTKKGQTPLQLAQQYFDNSPHAAIEQVLLEYGAK